MCRMWHKVTFFSGLQLIWIQSFFSLSSCHTKVKKPCLPKYLPIAVGRIVGYMPFPRLLVWREKQTVYFYDVTLKVPLIFIDSRKWTGLKFWNRFYTFNFQVHTVETRNFQIFLSQFWVLISVFHISLVVGIGFYNLLSFIIIIKVYQRHCFWWFSLPVSPSVSIRHDF